MVNISCTDKIRDIVAKIINSPTKSKIFFIVESNIKIRVEVLR